jgi:hypothetical protein
MSSSLVFGQSKGELSIQFGADQQSIQMSNTNSIILNESYLSVGELNLPRIDSFSDAVNFSTNISYQFLNNWSFGVYGNFQSATVNHYDGLYIVDGDFNILDTIDVQRKYLTTTISFGITSRLNISNLLGFQKKQGMLNRLLIGLNLSTGYGLSKFKVVEYWSFDDNVGLEMNRFNYKANGYQSKIGMDFGFILSKKSLITSIGLNLGYQRYVTDNFSNRTGATFLNTGYNSNVDFSGLYFGGNLTLSR